MIVKNKCAWCSGPHNENRNLDIYNQFGNMCGGCRKRVDQVIHHEKTREEADEELKEVRFHHRLRRIKRPKVVEVKKTVEVKEWWKIYK